MNMEPPRPLSYMEPTPYTSHTSAMPSPKSIPRPAGLGPRLVYYIVRPASGQAVPLIAADELPHDIHLQGVPRVLQWDQTGGMQHVGTMPYTGSFAANTSDLAVPYSRNVLPGSIKQYPIHHCDDVPTYLAPDYHARLTLVNATRDATSSHAARPSPLSTRVEDYRDSVNTNEEDSRSPVGFQQIEARNIASSVKSDQIPQHRVALPVKPVDQDKKKYCSYWMRTGECDYIQQGCIYKHEMPEKKTLAKIGFRQTPRWWLEKQRAIRMGGNKDAATGTSPLSGPKLKSQTWLRIKQRRGTASTISVNSDVDNESVGTSHRHNTPSSESTLSTKITSPTSEREANASTSTTSLASKLHVHQRNESQEGDLITFGPSEPVSSPAATIATAPSVAVDTPTTALVSTVDTPATTSEKNSPAPRLTLKDSIHAREEPAIMPGAKPRPRAQDVPVRRQRASAGTAIPTRSPGAEQVKPRPAAASRSGVTESETTRSASDKVARARTSPFTSPRAKAIPARQPSDHCTVKESIGNDPAATRSPRGKGKTAQESQDKSKVQARQSVATSPPASAKNEATRLPKPANNSRQLTTLRKLLLMERLEADRRAADDSSRARIPSS